LPRGVLVSLRDVGKATRPHEVREQTAGILGAVAEDVLGEGHKR